MKRSATILLVMLAGTCLAADRTNTVVTARVTAHRITAAGSMEPGDGFYLHRTDFVVTAPINCLGVVLTMESLRSDPRGS
jgi:hypothetical protein